MSNQPKVTILLTTYKDPPLLQDILESLEKTDYSNFDVLIIDCNSVKIQKILESMNFKACYLALQEDKGAAYQLNKGMRQALGHNDTRYIIRIEGDAIPQGSGWLQELVDVMESDPDVAIAMPIDTDRKGKLGYGGRLYGNCTFSPVPHPPSRVYPSIGTGGHCFITRRSYVEELFREGVEPYWDSFYISFEDIDFNLKAWLRGLKVVVTSSAKVLHEGTTMPHDGSYRTSYRVYHMYKNRLCLLLLNFGLKHILINIWYRLLHDITSAIIYSEPILMLKGYLWVITNLRPILQQRKLRMTRWKCVSDTELKRHILVRAPMPIKR
jgi:GT2 family glycosyltransferase